MSIAAVVLSFNRPQHVLRTVSQLVALGDALQEIIVVDNCSDVPCESVLANFQRVSVIRTAKNEGTSARNHGILRAQADVVITLDDDVFALTGDAVERLRSLFLDARLACVNFHVRDGSSGATMNWCHPYPKERYWRQSFWTNEISEGACAFRRSHVVQAGLYPESFFISHEGPDLAMRLLDRGHEVRYCPDISVCHEPAQQGRPGWRRYYFDTRNVFWLAARNLPLSYGLKRIIRQIGAMFVYATRDGFLRYWFRAVCDGLFGMRAAARDRRVISPRTLATMREMDRHRPGFIYWLRSRLLRKGVQI